MSEIRRASVGCWLMATGMTLDMVGDWSLKDTSGASLSVGLSSGGFPVGLGAESVLLAYPCNSTL